MVEVACEYGQRRHSSFGMAGTTKVVARAFTESPRTCMAGLAPCPKADIQRLDVQVDLSSQPFRLLVLVLGFDLLDDLDDLLGREATLTHGPLVAAGSF